MCDGDTRKIKRSLVGEVTGRPGDRSVKVSYFYRGRHPKYMKEVKQKTVFYAHDEKNSCSVGDTVEITETRPISKMKRWRVVSVLRKAVSA
ncbi:MAG: 30S ribosomal protein S17 [Puniceicoccales bacterium]|nr:30S ribosomal protein S17 [Puniceicoccales bacterium]